MRAVLQRVTEAEVRVEGRITGSCGSGYLILLGVAQGDTRAEAETLAAKIVKLRLFENDKGHFDLDLRETGGGILVVSQFTLHADTRKGRRPSFSKAARPETAEPLYDYFCDHLADMGIPVGRGVFGAMMDVRLVNHGPVTIILDTAK